MTAALKASDRSDRIVIIGAGIAGLAAAARLAPACNEILVLERHAHPGGKMRILPTPAGPVDAGPTVLTLRHVFDDLFSSLGERLEDHVTLVRQPLIARHFWPDGSRLDLYDDENRNAAAIRDFAGARAADQFRAFSRRAKMLFEALEAPVMFSPAPSLPGLARQVAAHPGTLRGLAPFSSLAALLDRQFDDPRLAQLFGRYATYVGGSPYRVPALLSLIWRAESAGVWAVRGGMQRLARAVACLAEARGAKFRYNSHVSRIDLRRGRVRGVELADGRRIQTGCVVFNGDPRALATGALGEGCHSVASATRRTPRSLSAEVWAFAATATGPDLAHHNVFFRDAPEPEFSAPGRGDLIDDPTLYVCAMDRGQAEAPPVKERFEIIANAPPLTVRDAAPDPEDFTRCQTRTFQTLARFGLRFDPMPAAENLTTPADFETLFPASAGSLYGQSPHGLMAAFRRPVARTKIEGLYLAGGGAHPGAGVPMAALSAKHAAEAILKDRISTSASRRTAMPGGMSTASATAVDGRSASSGS